MLTFWSLYFSTYQYSHLKKLIERKGNVNRKLKHRGPFFHAQ
jgi:hypothetical protein